MASACPLISVIIPTRDRPDLLMRAVRSVARQTYLHLEVIIVNDGHPGDLASRVKQVCPDLPCRVIVNDRRPGGAGARNMGAYVSVGEYLAFLDDDDEWLEDKLALQIQAMQRSHAMVGVICTHDIRIRDGRETVLMRALEGDIYRELCRKQTVGNTSSPLIARWAFEGAGMFDERMPAAQDADLWLRIAKRGVCFTTVPVPLVRVYEHDGERITRNVRKQIIGLAMLLWKHKRDLSMARKYRTVKRLLQLVWVGGRQRVKLHRE
jgi:glycosyltransferase involved in cell wall biosynthesis